MTLSRILGPDGQPMRLEDLGEEIAAPRLTGVRQVWHESVADNLTPSRLASILKCAAQGDADDYLTLAEEMEERDMHYASVLGTRKLAITGLDVRVDSLTDNAADVRVADAVRAFVDQPEFSEMVSHLVDALGKGYAVSEIVWNRDSNPWQPAYRERDPRWFEYDQADGRTLRLRDETNGMRGIPLVPYKFIVHEPRIRSGLPIRGGLARLAAVAYMCKAWSWRDWMAFADIYGLPMRVGKYGPNASKDDIGKLIAAVANLGSDAAAVMPQSMSIEFEQATQTSGAGDFFEKLASWWDRQISKGVLGQTMTADDGASLSQAQVHNGVRLDLLTADAKTLKNTLNRMLVQPFVDLNFGAGRYPTLVVQVPKPEDTKLLVDALAVLVPLGLEVEQSVVRDKLGLPDPAKGAVLLRQIAPPAPVSEEPPALNRARNAEMPPAPARVQWDSDEGDVVDIGADALGRVVDPLIAAWFEELRDLVNDAGSLEAARDQLLDRYAALSVTAMARQIAQALAVATLAGRADAQQWIDADSGMSPAINAEQPGARIIDRGWLPAGNFFLQKLNLPTNRWDDLWQGQHARAFVVAGVTRDAVLTDLRRAVEDAVMFGGSYDAFKRDFDDIVARMGWIGGAGGETAGGRAWRARTIWQTNLATAHAAGRYQQMTDPDTLAHMPYWQYRHNSVSNPREQHVGWSGLVLRWDDPWWQTHYPPNGWGCRCDVRPLSERQLARIQPPPSLQAPPPGAGDPPPEWAYNVGEAAWGKPVAKATIDAERGGSFVSLDDRGPADFGRPATVPFDATSTRPIGRITRREDLLPAFRTSLGADAAIVVDPTGTRVNVTDAIVEHWAEDVKRIGGRERFLPMLREVIEQPFEVWVAFARNELTGKVELRRRYVKGIELDGKGSALTLIADAVAGQWVSFNFFSGSMTGLAKSRVGQLLWGRGR